MTKAVSQGHIVSTADGRPYLVWGTTGQVAHVMPVRSNAVGVGYVTISGRTALHNAEHNAADMLYVDTVPRRHFGFAEIDRVGRVETGVLAEIAEEVARQRVEAAVRFVVASPVSVRFAPLHLADGGGPSPGFLAQRAAAAVRTVHAHAIRETPMRETAEMAGFA